MFSQKYKITIGNLSAAFKLGGKQTVRYVMTMKYQFVYI